jgi:HK97 family phage major capsid protein
MDENQVVEKLKGLVNDAKANMIDKDSFQKEVSELKSKFAGVEGLAAKFAETEKELAALGTMVKESVTKQNHKGDIDADNLKAINDIIPELIKRAEKKDNSPIILRIKANTDVVSLSGKVDQTDGDFPPSYYKPGVNAVPVRTNPIFQLANKFGVGGTDSIKWVEEVGVEGAATNPGENALKGQISDGFVVKRADVTKVTAFTKATKEMVKFAPALYDFIRRKVVYAIERRIDDQLLTGTGTFPQLQGIRSVSKTLTLAGLAGSTDAPTLYDAIEAALTQINESSEGNFQANSIFMRPSDYYKLRRAKITDGQLVYPAWWNNEAPNIMGVPVYQATHAGIEAGHVLLADMSKLNVALAGEIEIAIGLDGNDFTYNRFTILGERYLGSFIEGNDENAFIYDDFASMQAFIATT